EGHEIANKEDQLETEDVDPLEAKKKNGKKDELCIGMKFSFDETAHIAYSEHACNHGFNVRKQRRILYVCSKEWVRNEPKVKRSYTQPITKCGCKVHIAVKRSYTQPITKCGFKAHIACYVQSSGKYKIVSIEPNHNHNLVRTPMKHLLKGNRTVNISQKRYADNAEMSGILAKATVNMMSLKDGERENQEKDNSSLFYFMQLDENDMITNIFWTDDRSINYYNLFGDVFFEIFLRAMSGKQPKTILIDQSEAMANAINLSHVFHGPNQFAINFGKCVYDHDKEEDWLLAWMDVLNKNKLIENKGLKNLFDYFKRYLRRNFDLLTFKHYERVLDDRQYKGVVDNLCIMHTSPVLVTYVEMLQHAEEVYTPCMFTYFQKEYTFITDYVAKTRVWQYLVKYDAANQTIYCSCMKFSFVEIICRHALKM
ncbi:hypothetical protein N665_0055s0037, partial [Sinapis alba]